MTEHHTRQNRNAGAGFHRQRGKRGGVATVDERHVIALDGCWCGQPLGHDWPDKDLGAPHPREQEGTTMVATTDPVKARELRDFDKGTRDLLMEIINDFGVRYRIIDGGHLLLYPPDGVSRPFKVSASRQPQTNRQILEVQFMQEYGLVRTKPEPKAEPTPEQQTEEQPVVAQQAEQEQAETPVLTVVENDEMSDKVREAIAILTTALGVESLEEEALHALDENEALTRKVAALEGDLTRARSQADAERQEAERWKRKATEFETLLDEAVADRDRYKGKLDALKEALA